MAYNSKSYDVQNTGFTFLNKAFRIPVAVMLIVSGVLFMIGTYGSFEDGYFSWFKREKDGIQTFGMLAPFCSDQGRSEMLKPSPHSPLQLTSEWRPAQSRFSRTPRRVSSSRRAVSP